MSDWTAMWALLILANMHMLAGNKGPMWFFIGLAAGAFCWRVYKG